MKGNDIMKMPKETRKAVKRLMNYLLKQKISFEIQYHDLSEVMDITIVDEHLNYDKIEEILNTAHCSKSTVIRSCDVLYVLDWSENYD